MKPFFGFIVGPVKFIARLFLMQVGVLCCWLAFIVMSLLMEYIPEDALGTSTIVFLIMFAGYALYISYTANRSGHYNSQAQVVADQVADLLSSILMTGVLVFWVFGTLSVFNIETKSMYWLYMGFITAMWLLTLWEAILTYKNCARAMFEQNPISRVI